MDAMISKNGGRPAENDPSLEGIRKGEQLPVEMETLRQENGTGAPA